MNRSGSYLKLIGNSISAITAAIEIYNKPKFEYRDECFIILLINAWELALKAFLSKNKKPIFYSKKRNQPYKTLTIKDAIKECKKLWPSDIDFEPTKSNLDLLIKYRNNAIHFYNKNQISVIVYSLSQTSIINYKDFLDKCFNKNISSHITHILLPLAISSPIDPIAMLNQQINKCTQSKYVMDFCNGLKSIVEDLEKNGRDTGRMITTFKINLESVKKVSMADFTTSIDKDSENNNIAFKKTDPNDTYPLRQCDIVTSKKNPNEVGKAISYDGTTLTTYVFQAIVDRFDIRQNKKYCWVDNKTNTSRYSNCFVNYLKSLNKNEIEDAVAALNRKRAK